MIQSETRIRYTVSPQMERLIPNKLTNYHRCVVDRCEVLDFTVSLEFENKPSDLILKFYDRNCIIRMGR